MRSVPITVALAKPGGAEITFALKQPGQVSMAAYGADERLLRTLLSARPLGVGRHTVHWDGLDRDGVAHPPGDYTVELLKTDGLRSHLLAQVGINPVPFWEEGVGNHSPTAAVAVDAEGVVLVSNIMEGGFAIAKARPDRSYVWVGIDNHMEMFKQSFVQAGRNATKRILNFISWGYNPCASATVDGVTYILHNTGTVHRTDAHTGRMMDDLFSVQWNDGPDEIDRSGDALGQMSFLGQDVILFHVEDPAEREFPFAGQTIFRGLEQEGKLICEPRDLRQAYLAERTRPPGGDPGRLPSLWL